ncbi:MAG: acyltransferase [Clostridia bacterium]|nr:acyltransferase [Clostridia bacterium]
MKIIRKIKSIIKSFLGVDRGPNLQELKAMGMKVGENFIFDAGSTRFDSSHCWLIEIGNDVTFGPQVYLLAHDASTKKELGYTKIGRVVIQDKTFIGANTIIMPGVTVGKGSIVGTGSIVTHDVPAGCVYAGNPAKFICTTEEYYKKQKDNLSSLPVFDGSYTVGGNVTEEKKQQMIAELKNNGNKGFVV